LGIVLKILRYLYRRFWRLAFTFARPSVVRNAQPALSYAGLCLPGRLPASGGNVKLRTLAQQFPPNEKAANLLYLVSSGINIRSEEWAEACLRQGIKLVWNQNGVAYPAWAGDRTRDVNSRMARFMHCASFVVYQSEFCRRMSDKYLGVFKGPSAVIYNAVDTDVFTPRQKMRISSQTIRILVVGSHGDSSRFLWALETLVLLRQGGVQAELDIAGSLSWPGAEKEMRSAVERLKLAGAVRFLGPFSQQEAPGLYRRADVLLHLQHGDACPTVVLEAMACEVPVIAPASGGIPELVGDTGVLLTAPDAEKPFVPDVQNVAEAVKRACQEHDRLSSAARERVVRRFDMQGWLEQHRQIFEKVLGS
jgi:glycosyltransferase involved in cell wall biosynthesis